MKHFGISQAVFFAAMLLIIPLLGCEGDTGPAGRTGTSTGIVTGSVTIDSPGAPADGAPLGGVEVTPDPAPEGAATTTDANGNYSLTLPTGNYALTFEKNNFNTLATSASALAGQTTTADAALAPTSGVIVEAGDDVGAQPGEAVDLSVTTEILDGSTTPIFLWEQVGSVAVTILNAATATPTVILPGVEAYRTELFRLIDEPPITAEELPPNVPVPEEPFPAGLQDRFGVQGINPFALEEAGLVTLKVTVTTSSGSFEDEVEIHAELPWKPQAGIRTVPTDVPVLLHGKDQTAYDWQLTAVPADSSLPTGSTAFTNAASQNPDFTPDAVGIYTVSEINNGTAFDIFAGQWVGVITGQDVDGRPVWDSGCAACHDNATAPDKFTPWSLSGHAEIFTDNFNTSSHYSTGCFDCHTVGFNTEAANGGIDDQPDYQAFLDQFTSDGVNFIPDEDNWTNMLANTPDTARHANIQCENCHGPQDTGTGGAHTTGAPRINISSDVCAVCHGEPLRHARFQQWQLSGHANYYLAIEEGVDEDTGFARSCVLCHTGNGFIEWAELDFSPDSATEDAVIAAVNSSVVVSLEDEIHPQTCPACHNPHNPGSESGDPSNATVRVSGSTSELRAGFTAAGVGRGAVCMTCHNTRRGLRNDEDAFVFPGARAPHAGAQTDVLMGQNAYFVDVGVRSPHSFLPDTCVTCHMEATPPPGLLAYNLGGTNHTFFASIEICAECHVGIEGEDIQDAVEAELSSIGDVIEDAVKTMVNTRLGVGFSNGITLNDAENVDTEVSSDVSVPAGNTITADNFTDSHGRQSIEITTAGTTYLVQLRRIEITESGELVFEVDCDPGCNETTEQAQIAVKAGWNWLLMDDDKSKGVHNPRYVFNVLGETLSALKVTDFTLVNSCTPDIVTDTCI
jgi:hypothetical protein